MIKGMMVIASVPPPADIKQYEAPKPKPVLEEKREWSHGTGGRGPQCSRANRPIFTDPNKTPDICRSYDCNNGEWDSKGLVKREKSSGRVVERDGKSVS